MSANGRRSRGPDEPGSPAAAADRAPGRGQPPAEAPDYALAFTPRQLAGGFAILAALLVLIVGRRRRGRTRGD